jgi:glycosyltransferase involved in cell wall biosynthesis
MAMAADAVALADELGLRDRAVFFNFGWVPLADRGRYLLDADLAVSAHFDNVETRFAFRTRLLDCLWAGLPVVTTVGDSLGDLLVGRGAGRAVGFGDVAGWVHTLGELLDDAAARDRVRAAAAELRPQFEWPTALAPLRRLAKAAGDDGRPPHARTRALDAEYVWLRLRIGRELHGWTGAARRLAGRARARVARSKRLG